MQETLHAAVSDRQRLFEYIQSKGVEFNTLYTYEELEAFLGKPRNVVQSLVYSLKKKLLKTNNRYLEAKPGEGWRVIPANEHTRVADEYTGKAIKALGRAVGVIVGTDRSPLSPRERDELDHRRAGYYALVRKVDEDSKKIQRMEAIQAVHVKVTQTHEDRLDAMERELAELKRLRAQS